MAPKDIISRTLDAGRGVGQRSQDRIEGIVGQLQRMSEEQLDQVVALLGELRDRSVLSGEQAASAVDRRVREQLSSLGLATKADVDRLEAKVDALTTDVPAGAPSTKSSARKTPAGSRGAKKASSSKGSTKGSATKSSASKSAAKKRPAKKVAPSRSTATGGGAAGSRTAG
jgi:polyhydroxyalkanoate synthesis regulator phasin